MNCDQTEKCVRLLLDAETDLSEKREIESHIAICDSCRAEILTHKRTSDALKNQIAILPSSAFDRGMLRSFGQRLGPQPVSPSIWNSWLGGLQKRALAFGAIAMLLSAGAGGFIGRNSVFLPDSRLTQMGDRESPSEEAAINSPTLVKQKARSVEQDSNEEVKTIIKYVPVIREKIVEKRIYVSTDPSAQTAPKPTVAVAAQSSDVTAGQFNLKDMRSPEKLSYKIIRKGGE